MTLTTSNAWFKGSCYAPDVIKVISKKTLCRIAFTSNLTNSFA